MVTPDETPAEWEDVEVAQIIGTELSGLPDGVEVRRIGFVGWEARIINTRHPDEAECRWRFTRDGAVSSVLRVQRRLQRLADKAAGTGRYKWHR